MHGLGNDFVVLDRISQPIVLTNELLTRIGNRQLGIGCDQIIVIDPPTHPEHDFNYRVFNATGEEVEQCGNGARCFGRYVHESGLTHKEKIIVGSLSGAIHINLEDPTHIEVSLGKPKFPPAAKDIYANSLKKISTGRYKLILNGIEKEAALLSMGNPHCVFAVSNIRDADVTTIGKMLQQNVCFPKGVNVSFVETLAKNHIKLRVFERGVGETQACGTAACAAVVAGAMRNDLNPHVQVDMPGGSLTVQWDKNEGARICGHTQIVFEGYFLI